MYIIRLLFNLGASVNGKPAVSKTATGSSILSAPADYYRLTCAPYSLILLFMLTLENRFINPIPERFSPEHEIDRLRPAFMHHVISPLAHTAVVRSIDMFGGRFLRNLYGLEGDLIRKKAAYEYGDNSFNPYKHADKALVFLDHSLGDMSRSQAVYPVWNFLTDRQQAAAKRFTLFANSNSAADVALFNQASTVTDTIITIHEHHPELNLNNTTNLVNFLRDPSTPSILRGIALGGSSFADSLRGLSDHPAGKPWREDIHLPILDASRHPLRTTKAIRDAAYAHRKQNQTMSTDELMGNGIFNVAMRYSSGCPVRQLYFDTDVKDLVEEGLNLSSNQAALLTGGKQPVIQQTDKYRYNIVRDATAEVSSLLADALEIITA